MDFSGPDDSDGLDIAFDRAERDRKRNYPRGQGPTYDQLAGEDSNGPEYDDPEGFSLDQHDPGRYLSDPGFGEDETDDWPDPDHGRENHRVGAILTQREQWPHRLAYTGSGKTESELVKPQHVVGDGIHLMKGEDTGLYGEDEDHPYDAYGMANEHGGYDVVGYPTPHPSKHHK